MSKRWYEEASVDTLVLWAAVRGVVRYELLSTSDVEGIVVIDGLRYACHTNQYGCLQIDSMAVIGMIKNQIAKYLNHHDRFND